MPISESRNLPDRLVTTQHDPRHSSAIELAALYYERRKVDTRPAV
ncbi:MAG: hypothetical protein OXN89_19775 [Bryobacterales bacterium]|nr:hypothetical protein [Bryobacterales bacterium]